MLRILYLVHDLSDPSVRRRVLMLRMGGGDVALGGFSRRSNPLADIEGIVPIDLGRTRDGQFVHRVASVGRAALALPGRLDRENRPDVIIARNLEMLALAHRARTLLGGDLPVVYECLDIHRLMLGTDITGRLLRAVERRLGGKSVLLITSSPAFVEHYFRKFGQFDIPVEIVENKVLEIDSRNISNVMTATAPPTGGKPWRIGWFGALRCQRSFALLSMLARRMQGRVEIVLRGRPAFDQLDDFDRAVAECPHLTFEGPYANPEDLARIYGEVHFSWLPDFFEEGMNSNWLLPNRLYEGCRYATVPIAMEKTQTGQYLRDKGIGFNLPDPTLAALENLLDQCLKEETYVAAARDVVAQEMSTWRIDRAECVALVKRLDKLSRPLRPAA